MMSASPARLSSRGEQRLSRLHTGEGVGTPFRLTARLDSGEVGVECGWQTPEGWADRRYHLGSNKEVFGAETYAIHRVLRILD